MSKAKNILAIDIVGLSGIGVYAFFSSLFSGDFAEIHMQLSFLNFPIFIGEMLMISLAFLLLFKLLLSDGFKPWHWAWGGFIAFILIYAAIGYAGYGPHAFRNAALFYYIIFALFGYSFYNPRILGSYKYGSMLILAIFMEIILIRNYAGYFWYTYFALVLVLVLKHIPFKYRFFVLPIVVAVFRPDELFLSSRAHLFAVLGSAVFVWLVGSYIYLAKLSRWKYIFINLGVVVVMIIGLLKVSDPNTVKSIFDLSPFVKYYKRYSLEVEENRHLYKPRFLESQLYHPNDQRGLADITLRSASRHEFDVSFNVTSQSPVLEVVKSWPSLVDASSGTVLVQKSDNKSSKVKAVIKEALNDLKINNERVIDKTERDINVAHINVLFRVFIWRDMLMELVDNKAIFGVGFGKPQRSPSIEILNWAIAEWTRDGWIEPHNAYLHMIYRAGIFGIVIVVGLCWAFIHLIRVFIKRRDIKGILLLSILVYWCVMALFSVTLELPYYAILFWSLLGMIFAYSKEHVHGRSN